MLKRLWQSPAFRWLTLIPVCLVAVGVTQIVMAILVGKAIGLATGDYLPWLTKSIVSPFMGAMIVIAPTLWAPSRKKVVLLAASAVAVLWGAYLSVGAILSVGTILESTADPVLWMGLLGATGGLLSAWLYLRHLKMQ